MEFPGFIGPTYQSKSLIADAEQCVNLYPETVESGAGKNKIVLYGTPGLSRLGYSPVSGYPNIPGAIMAMKSVWNAKAGKSQTYFLTTGLETNSGNRTISLYLTLNFGLQAKATLPGSGYPPQAAFLASNGKQIIVALKMSDNPVPGTPVSSLLYSFDLTAPIPALTQVTSWDSTQPITGLDFLDGFFLITTTGSLYCSALNDGTSWNALNYTNESDEPDGITGLMVDHRLVWIFGKTRIEAFYNAGGVDFPFQRIPQGVIENGCNCAGSIVACGESLFWVGYGKGGGPQVFRNNGYDAARISNYYVESLLEKYASAADQVNPAGLSGYVGGGSINAAWLGVRAYSYRQNGHLFYVLNFGGNNAAANAAYGYPATADPGTTLVYDATENLWHERQFSLDGVTFARHLGHFYAYDMASGTHLVTDYRNTSLYAMGTQYLDDNGTAIKRWRTAPHISNENKRIRYHTFTLDCEVGTEGGNSTQQTLTLSWSDDGGQTWSSNRALAVGQSGNTKARAIWRRLGRGRDRVFKMFTQDAMNVAWINAYLEVTEDNS